MTKTIKRSLAATILLAACSFGAAAFAGTTGGLNGVLTDADTNVALGGAKITATSPSQIATVTTDNGGHYSFPNLAPDTYTVTTSHAGYEDATTSGIEVTSDQQLTVNLTEPKAKAAP